MALYLGNQEIKSVYLGTQKVSKVYFGTQLVYPTGLSLNWNPREIFHGSGDREDMIYSTTNSRFYAVGRKSTGGAGYSTSPNGMDWDDTSSVPGILSLYGICEAGPGYIYACGTNGRWARNGTLYSSNAGTTATLWGIAGTPAFSSNRWHIVTVGENGTIMFTNPYTTSAASWYKKTAGNITTRLRTVRYANNTFIAVGASGRFARSTDYGETWTAGTLPASTREYAGLTYADGVWVTTADGGAAAYSTDNGVTWTAATVPTKEHMLCLAYGLGYFVTMDVVGNWASSPDGKTWIYGGQQTWRDGLSGSWGMAFGAGRFVTIGQSCIYGHTS